MAELSSRPVTHVLALSVWGLVAVGCTGLEHCYATQGLAFAYKWRCSKQTMAPRPAQERSQQCLCVPRQVVKPPPKYGKAFILGLLVGVLRHSIHCAAASTCPATPRGGNCFAHCWPPRRAGQFHVAAAAQRRAPANHSPTAQHRRCNWAL